MRALDFETPILRAATFVATWVATIFVGASLGAPLLAAYPAALVPAVGVAALVRGEQGDRPDARAVRLGCGVAALGLAWILLLFAGGMALPPGDPVAVPQLAGDIARGLLPSQAFAPGTSGHAYPPGYPILFAPVALVLGPLARLVVFKAATLACAAAVPVAWAWLHVRLFEERTPFPAVLGLAYVAFLVLDRTLAFAVPFAGKNAVLMGLLMFPAVLLAVLALCRRPWAWPLAALPLYGLVLVHYTMLHLAAAFLAAYFLIAVWRRPGLWTVAVRAALAGLAAAGLVLLLNSAVLADARTGSFAFQPLAGLAALGRALVAAEPGFVVYTGTSFIPPAPFRGLVLLAACALVLLAGERARARAALVYLLAFLISLAFAMGVVPVGVKLDFMRWFAWPLQAGVFLCAGLALAALWRRLTPRWRLLRWGLAGAAAGAAALVLVTDGRPERGFFRGVSPDGVQLGAVARLLAPTGGSGCALIGDSIADPVGVVVVQRSAAWTYAEAMSDCRFLNGSWMQGGAPAGRAVDGYPSAAVVRTLPAATRLFFVGRPASFAAYRQYLAAQGVTRGWTPVGAAPPDGAVWRALPPSG